ncbi:MAG: hypothetical protein LC723_03940 [Actinobacteria bacterium]|nr:hypothetical protein [Actinomycetota bacterium]
MGPGTPRKTAAAGPSNAGRWDDLVAPKHRHLLADENVARWFRDLCKGSLNTGREYVRVLGRIMEKMGTTPAAFVAQGARKCEADVLDYVDEYAAKHAGSSAKYHGHVLASWLKWNDIPMKRSIKVSAETYHPRNEATTIPSRDDLRRVLTVASVRARFIIACTAYSALRPRVLSDADQGDGLRFADLPETRIEDGKLVFDAVPTMVKVRKNLSKNKKAYVTFLPREACEYLAAYVGERLQAGEDITPDSVVVAPIKNSKSGFIVREQLFKIVREPMRKAGVKGNPYIWKSYCSDKMGLGEHDGFLRDYRIFMMGHNGSMASDYALRKGELTPETKAAMRQAYEKLATKHLEAFPVVKADDVRLGQFRATLTMLGYTSEQLQEMDLANMTEEEVVGLARGAMKNLTGTVAEAAPSKAPVAKQRVVGAKEWEPLLEQGWVYKMALPDGRVLMERT